MGTDATWLILCKEDWKSHVRILTYNIDDEKEWVKTKRVININLDLITADSMDGLVNLEFLASVESASGSTPPVAVESPGSVMIQLCIAVLMISRHQRRSQKSFRKKT